MTRNDLFRRFIAKVDMSAGLDGCWPWTAAIDRQGYGVFQLGRDLGSARTHRWFLGYLRGQPLRWDDEARELALHHCDNPPCVNPAHLYVGDYSRNQADAVSRGRHHNANKTHCKRGHEFTDENTYVMPSTGGRDCRHCIRYRDQERRR